MGGLSNSAVLSGRVGRQTADAFDRLAWSQWRTARSDALRRLVETFVRHPEKMVEMLELLGYQRPARLAKSMRYRVITGWTGMLDGSELKLSRGSIIDRLVDVWLPERLFALGAALVPAD